MQRLKARIGTRALRELGSGRCARGFHWVAIIRPHRSSPDRVRQCTPKVSGALTSLDPRWGRSIRALAMSSLSNSSKPRTSCGWVRLGLAGHIWLLDSKSSDLEEHVTRAGGRGDARADLRFERQLESEIWKQQSPLHVQFPLIKDAGFTFLPL